MKVWLVSVIVSFAGILSAQESSHDTLKYPRFAISIGMGYAFPAFKNYRTRNSYPVTNGFKFESTSSHLRTGYNVLFQGEVQFSDWFSTLIEFQNFWEKEIDEGSDIGLNTQIQKLKSDIDSYGIGTRFYSRHWGLKFYSDLMWHFSFTSSVERTIITNIGPGTTERHILYTDFFNVSGRLGIGCSYALVENLGISLGCILNVGVFKPDRGKVLFKENLTRNQRETIFLDELSAAIPENEDEPHKATYFTITMMSISPVLSISYSF